MSAGSVAAVGCAVLAGSVAAVGSGVPVATVSVGGARNAGLLAVRILAAGQGPEAAALRTAMLAFQQDLRGQAVAKGERLRARSTQRTGFTA